MARKIPADAYEYYFSQGPSRSYEAVALHYGVSKRAVTQLAGREDWQGRLRAAEIKAKQATDLKVAETLETMRERHLKVYQAIQRKALEALRAAPLDTAIQAVRALSIALDGERLLRGGQDGKATGAELEAIIRREYETIMLKPGEKDDWNFDAPRP